jgi:hypothetical protein
VLFANGSREVKVNAKLIFTSNNMAISDDDDGGIRRRINYYECVKKITDNTSLVDNKTVFEKKPFGVDNITDVLRSGIFYYIFSQTHLLYQRAKIKQPPNICSGDKIRDFRSFVDELLY